MRFVGRVFKVDKFWAIEIPILGITTQGRSKKDAYDMICDAIVTLVNKEGFSVKLHGGEEEYFEISSNDPAALSAFLLRQLRQKSGLTLQDVAKRLGAKSLNSYARYEQGKSVPTIEKLGALISAVTPEHDFVITESRA
jgi:hypothetical protein